MSKQKLEKAKQRKGDQNPQKRKRVPATPVIGKEETGSTESGEEDKGAKM